MAMLKGGGILSDSDRRRGHLIAENAGDNKMYNLNSPGSR
jgi:hypothetical protein